MADSKVTALAEKTTVLGADLVYLASAAGTAEWKASTANVVAGGLANDLIKDTHIDWGTGASQVSAADVPTADAGGFYTTDTVEASLQQVGMVKISGTVLAAAAGTVTFASIPSGYNDLQITSVMRSNADTSTTNPIIRCNSDTAANYDNQQMTATVTTLSATENIGTVGWFMGAIPAGSATANCPGMAICNIPGYAGTTFYKIMQGFNPREQTTASGGVYIRVFGGVWRNTAAITQLDISSSAGSFAAGSRFALYGIP